MLTELVNVLMIPAPKLPLIPPATKRRRFSRGRNNDTPTARLWAIEVFFLILQFCRNKYRKKKIAKLDLYRETKKDLII
jgi:hypothetical protein